jgi:hypothetical protein
MWRTLVRLFDIPERSPTGFVPEHAVVPGAVGKRAQRLDALDERIGLRAWSYNHSLCGTEGVVGFDPRD